MAGFQTAHAQSSVTIYGIIDAGITYTNNSGGSSRYQAQSGTVAGNRWGLRGTEDLGGGAHAIFVLESGFNVFDGTSSQGGREFGRQAYVGLGSDRLGTLTLGRQYDFAVDFVQAYTTLSGAGVQVPHPGDMDNELGSVRANNSVKYTTPTIRGWKAGGMYSLGGIAGDFTNQGVLSFGTSYATGPFAAGVAYTHTNRPGLAAPEGPYTSSNVINGTYAANASASQVIAAGASYQIGRAKFALSYSDVVFRHGLSGQDVKFDNYEIIGRYYFTPADIVSTSYTYTHGKINVNAHVPLYHTITLMADHFFSKRTDVYLLTAYQKAGGSATQAQLSTVLTASKTDSQIMVRVGLMHRF